MRGQDSSGPMQVASPAVVTEPFPRPQDLLFVGGRQVAERRKRLQETFEARDDRGHRRLLEHDFADPYSIGIAIRSPGKIASMAIEPVQEART